ncbi:MAG: PilZ domain-containing protein [Spirochaetales bacterium]|nr:PilZ domain-containing protein [Spirochaetales bacterium]
MTERRRTSRVELNIDITNSTENAIESKNVNEHGLCLITSEQFDVGQYFRRSFILPTGAGISIFGKVVWCQIKKHKVYESGIQFISLGSADKEHLRQFIKKKLKRKVK